MAKASEPLRIELDGALAGHYLQVDPDGVTLGLLEDVQSGRIADVLDGLATCIVGGDLPHGTDRAGLRKLTLPQFGSVAAGLAGAMTVPKES